MLKWNQRHHYNGEGDRAQLRRKLLLGLAIVALYALHQDVWFWRTAQPLVFGFLPIGLAYHGAYCVATAGLMWALTTMAWPSHLEEDASAAAVRKEPPRR
jgi:hypothetical protein